MVITELPINLDKIVSTRVASSTKNTLCNFGNYGNYLITFLQILTVVQPTS